MLCLTTVVASIIYAKLRTDEMVRLYKVGGAPTESTHSRENQALDLRPARASNCRAKMHCDGLIPPTLPDGQGNKRRVPDGQLQPDAASTAKCVLPHLLLFLVSRFHGSTCTRGRMPSVGAVTPHAQLGGAFSPVGHTRRGLLTTTSDASCDAAIDSCLEDSACYALKSHLTH